VTWLVFPWPPTLRAMTKPKRGPGRPPLAPGDRRIAVHVRFNPSTLARLDELAARWGVTRTEALERLVWGEEKET
jgi:hypothetical protein